MYQTDATLALSSDQFNFLSQCADALWCRKV